MERDARREPPIHAENFLSKVTVTSNFMVGGGNNGDFLLDPLSYPKKYSPASRDHCVGKQILTDLSVTLDNAVVCSVANARKIHTQVEGMKKDFRALKPLDVDCGHPAIRELKEIITLLNAVAFGSCRHVLKSRAT